MSLLIQALKEAERKNKLAAQQAARVDVELPPAPMDTADQAVSATHDSGAAMESAPAPAAASPSERVDLSLEATESSPPRQDYPSLHSMDELSENALLTPELDTELPGMPDLPEPHAFPRQAEPDDAPSRESATIKPSSIETPAPTPPSLQTIEEAAPEVAEPAPYLAPAAGLKGKARLSRRQGQWAIAAGIALLIGAAVIWSPLASTPDTPNTAYSTDFQAMMAPAPAIRPTGAFGTTAENTVAPIQPDTDLSLTGSAAVAATDPAAAESATTETSAAADTPISDEAIDNQASAATLDASASASASDAASPVAKAPASSSRPATTSKQTTLVRTVAPASSTSTSAPAMPPVRFVKVKPSQESSSELLNKGYEALRAQRLTEAETAYQAAVRLNRNLIDGWIGLASIASHRGSTAMAEQYYRRALQIDPNDSVARTGLLSLGGTALAEESESALRTLSSDPQAQSTAQLTLGNTLASQGRWREAQQAYFNANAAQPDRPDVLFNLAVSLERIHQPAAALRYYQRALDNAGDSTVIFDRSVARQRIDALQADRSR